MIFIDKSLRAKEGREINIRFLKDHFDTSIFKFSIPLDKAAYRIYATDSKYKRIWRRLLCEEQNYLCCYCMRQLSTENFSAEHIIPQSLRGEENRGEYLRYVSGKENAPNIVDGVEYSDDTEARTYSSETEIDTLSKMPHIISHQNLLAACRGVRERHFSYDVAELQRIQIFKSAFKQTNYLMIPKQYRAYAGKIMGNGNDYTWNLLVDYRWFLNYYRQK